MALGFIPEPEPRYALRLGLVLVVLLWARRSWPSLRGPGQPWVSVLVGVGAGLLGVVVWVLLLQPFLDRAQPAPAWSPTAWALRLAAAGLLVPFCEELWCRGYVLRVALQWDQARRSGASDALGQALDARDLRAVEPGAWSVLAVLASTAMFVFGHAPPEYLAATSYGLLMAGLWVVRGDLLTCVVAHGVSNLALGAWVLQRGAWELW